MENVVSLPEIQSYRLCPMQYHLRYRARQWRSAMTTDDVARLTYFRLLTDVHSACINGRSIPDVTAEVAAQWSNLEAKYGEPQTGDFSAAQLKTLIQEAISNYAGHLTKGDLGTPVQFDLVILTPLKDAGEIGFRHKIHAVFKRENGHMAIVRHRFSPARPAVEPGDPWLLADGCIAGRELHGAEVSVFTYHPWFHVILEHSPDDGAYQLWWDEMTGLVDLIRRERVFPPRPGRHCLTCGAREHCPVTAESPGVETLHARIHDPLVRMAHRFVEINHQLETLEAERTEIMTAMAEVCRRRKLSEIHDIAGRVLLQREVTYRLPRRGSRRRRELETRLKELGFPGKMSGEVIAEWLRSGTVAEEIRLQIEALLDSVVRWNGG